MRKYYYKTFATVEENSKIRIGTYIDWWSIIVKIKFKITN